MAAAVAAALSTFQTGSRKGKRTKTATLQSMDCAPFKEPSQSPILQLLLKPDWPALSHRASLAAREAGPCSLIPEYIVAPENIRGLEPRRGNGFQEDSGHVMPGFGTPTSQGGHNGLSHLSLKGKSHSQSHESLGETGGVFSWGLLCAAQNEASQRE